jgi:segregation and condensation protein A
MSLPTKPASLPRARLDHFEGPLDLLLDEVRRQNVAIEDIALAPVVARYLEYMRSAADVNLNLDIEWLHMAATLILWKSRALLSPGVDAVYETDPIRHELVQQLLAHRKRAAEELARRRIVEETRLSPTPGEEFGEPQTGNQSDVPAFVSVWDLMQQAREIAGWAEQQRKDRRQWRESLGVEADGVTVMEMIAYLEGRLSSAQSKIDITVLLREQPSIPHSRCLFLAALEMVRDQQARLQQKEAFGPLWMIAFSRERDDATGS